MKDELGDRIKSYYEDRTRQYLPRRTNTIIRIDGKAFHTYTKGLIKPFDIGLIDDMNETTKFLCANIQGAKLGYVQSDEISILMTDYDTITTDAWFDGNIQKITSIAASMTTAKFNELRFKRTGEVKLAYFDARVFTIPHIEEVVNYFIWRQQDATKNSISSVAQNLYSHEQLEGKDSEEKQEMIFRKGFNWNDFPVGQKRGRTILRKQVIIPSTEDVFNKAREKDKDNWVWDAIDGFGIKRNQWRIDEPPIFSKDKEYVKNTIIKKEV